MFAVKPWPVVEDGARSRRELDVPLPCWHLSHSVVFVLFCLSYLLGEECICSSLDVAFSKIRRSGSIPVKS